MNRPELVNDFMLDMVTTPEVSPKDEALFDYIISLECELSKYANTSKPWYHTKEGQTIIKLKKPTVWG